LQFVSLLESANPTVQERTARHPRLARISHRPSSALRLWRTRTPTGA
jgi:hypothetical protein